MSGALTAGPFAGPAGRPAVPWCIAHRGASARAPENTLPAFEMALRDGAEAIELDVRRTADGVPVVLHDATLERTTSGRGALAETSLATLRRLDAGGWFAPRYRGARVPTLAEVLDFCRARAGLNLELKLDGPAVAGRRARRTEAQALAEAVAGVLARSRFRDFLLLSSFDRLALEAARSARPAELLGLLVSRSTRAVGATHRRLSLHSVNLHRRLASRRRIAAAHRRGLRVYVWPVNEPREMSRLAAFGADGLMTDDPRLMPRRPLPPLLT